MNMQIKKYFPLIAYLSLILVGIGFQKPEEKIKPINYEILRKWVPGKRGVGMEILVSPQNTKDEVMSLAKRLLQENRGKGQIVIQIFDSKEAWANRYNDNYPEAKYFKHFLVSIFVPAINADEIKWVAEGRDEPAKK